eukprot:364602-Chlamydomonas_euryale.AAC.14
MLAACAHTHSQRCMSDQGQNARCTHTEHCMALCDILTHHCTPVSHFLIPYVVIITRRLLQERPGVALRAARTDDEISNLRAAAAAAPAAPRRARARMPAAMHSSPEGRPRRPAPSGHARGGRTTPLNEAGGLGSRVASRSARTPRLRPTSGGGQRTGPRALQAGRGRGAWREGGARAVRGRRGAAARRPPAAC